MPKPRRAGAAPKPTARALAQQAKYEKALSETRARQDPAATPQAERERPPVIKERLI